MNEYKPESIARDGDYAGIIVSKIEFYPEDIKKINSMSVNEAIAYKAKLIKTGKYILPWN